MATVIPSTSLSISRRGKLCCRASLKVWLQTEDYLKDALGSVITDIEEMAINLLAFVDAQVNAFVLEYEDEKRIAQVESPPVCEFIHRASYPLQK